MKIDEPKNGERDARTARNYTEAIIRTTRFPFLVLRADLRVNTANDAFYKTFQTTADQTQGRLIYEVGNRQWDIPKLRALLEEILPRDAVFNDFEVKRNFPHIGHRTILLNARRLDQEAGTPQMILIAMEDITERLRLAERGRVSEVRYRRLFEAARDGVLLVDPVSRKITDANPFMTDLLGYTREELLGKELWQIGLLKDEQSSHAAFRKLQQVGFVRYEDLPLQARSGEKREVEVVANRYTEDGTPVIQCNVRDITDRKRLEQELAEKARLLDLSNDAIMVRGLDNKISVWNKGAEKLYGWKGEEVIGKDLHSLMQTEFPKPMEEIIAQLHRERQFRGEVVQIARDGRRIASLCRWVLDQETQSILTSYTDITDRKQTEEARSRLAAIVESSEDAIISINCEGVITSWNRGAERLYGYTPQEAIGQPVTMLTPPDHFDEEPSILERVRQGESVTHYETVRCGKGGTLLDISLTASPIRNTDGKIVGASKIARDITEQKRMEKALRESEERYRTLFSLGPVAVYSIDTSGVIQNFNHRAAELWGRAPVLGDTDQRFCGSFKMFRKDGTFMPHDECPMAEVVSGKISAANDAEVHIERADGSRVTVIVNIRPLKNDRGEVIGAINCFYDITERKRDEDALRLAKAQLAERAGQLEQAVAERTGELTATNKQLEAFVYSIAHDLRAPVRAMQGFSEMLVEEAGLALNERAKGYAHRISNSAQFIDALLRDLLAFSRIAQQQVELASMNPETVVQAVLSRLESDIQEKNAQVEMLAPWPAVLAHEPTLGQVIFNLVSNALKFTAADRRPHVRLHAEENGQFVRVWVEDNGIGIAPEHQEQIFRLFTRLHGERYPGTGVGLAIVQKGVERMGGRVGVESDAGLGSRFWFELRKANP